MYGVDFRSISDMPVHVSINPSSASQTAYRIEKHEAMSMDLDESAQDSPRPQTNPCHDFFVVTCHKRMNR